MHWLAPASLLVAAKCCGSYTTEETTMALYTHGSLCVHAVKALTSAMPNVTHETMRDTQQVPRSSLLCASENGKRFQLANTCDCVCSCAHSTVPNHLERNPHLLYKEHLLLGVLMCLLKLVILIAAIGHVHAIIVLLHASAENRLCRRLCVYLGIP